MSKPACVNVTAGIVTLEATDFSFPGFIPFALVRSYRSNSGAQGLLGPAWGVNIGEDLLADGAELVLLNAEGRAVRLPRPQPGAEPVQNPVEGIQLSAEWHQTPTGMTTVFGIRSGDRIRRYGRVDHSGRYRLVRIEDAHGNALRFTYGGGRLTEIEDTLQRRFLLTYDHHGRLSSIHLLGAGGWLQLVSYAYDADGLLAAVSKQSGTVNRYYYQDRLLVLHTDDHGVSYHNVYDDRRRCVRSWRGNGWYKREYHYDHQRHQTLVVNSLGSATLYRYNEFNLVTETVDALGGISRFHYDEGNNVMLAVNQVDSATLINYDPGKRPLAITRADGSAESYRYDPDGRPVEYVNAAGGIHTAEYNAWGDLVASTTPGGATTRFEYDRRGATTAITFDNGERLVREYGPDFIRFRHGDGVLIERRFDAFGRPVRSEYHGRYRVELRYDPQGRLAQELGIGGAVRQYAYDEAGRLRTMQDERGRVTTFAYNEIGLRTAAERAGQRTEYSYDSEGHLAEIRNSRGERHRISYDVLGRMVGQHFFDGRTEHYTHDAAGGIRSIRDSAGREIAYELDPLGRPLVERHTDGTTCEFAYAPGGAIARAARNGYVVEFEYDQQGRVTLQRQDTLELRYEYNRLGKLVRMADSAGRAAELERDALMRVRTALIGTSSEEPDAPLPHRLSFEYDELNALAAIELAGGPRLERQVNGWRKPAWQRASLAGQTLLEERFGYDEAGMLAERASLHGPALGFRYDPAGSLASVTEGGRISESYAFDSELNLIRKQWSYGAQFERATLEYGPGNRLARVGDREYTYDQAGLLAGVVDAGAETRCTYSVDDLLLRVDSPDGAVTEFRYDALRRRVAKTSAGRETRFYWDQQTLWAEQLLEPDPDEGGLRSTRTVAYLFDPASWALLAAVVDGRCQLVVNDPLGAPHTVLDSGGAIVWQLRTTAWGEVIGGASAPEAHMPIRFPGQYADAETGLHYNLNRYYEPGTGRYTTPDPIGLRGGVNSYSYTADPVNFADPLGLECQNFAQGEPSTLYRGDSRPPSEICGKGFSPRNPAAVISIADHVGGKTRGWVSTSYDYDTAERFGKESGSQQYVYVIANPACAANPGHEVDCDPGVQKRQEDLKKMGVDPEESEFEIAFKNVPASAVVGFIPIAPDGTVGDFTVC